MLRREMVVGGGRRLVIGMSKKIENAATSKNGKSLGERRRLEDVKKQPIRRFSSKIHDLHN